MIRTDTAAILFDLDGTLVDSAPDLLGALDAVLERRGLPPSDHARLRHHASRGAAGILEAGLPADAAVDVEALKAEFLDFYADNLWRATRPFEGIEPLLEWLGAHAMQLGIVTNKINRFTQPVLAQAGWLDRFGCVVTGDSISRPKPDPEPVLAACQALGVEPARTLFVGDDLRDVQAGRRAGVQTAVAAWGYLPPEADVAAWGADRVVDSPAALQALLEEIQAGACRL